MQLREINRVRELCSSQNKVMLITMKKPHNTTHFLHDEWAFEWVYVMDASLVDARDALWGYTSESTCSVLQLAIP